MAQQRIYLGTVVSVLPAGGDDKHPVYVLDGKVYPIESVANADNADVAEKLGTSTVGGVTQAVYIKDGIPTPVDSVDVAIKVGTDTVGGPNHPIYLKEGVPTPIDSVDIGTGTPDDIMLGDGTTVSIDKFLDDHIEEIREKIGIVTTERIGLVPKLPEDPEVIGL